MSIGPTGLFFPCGAAVSCISDRTKSAHGPAHEWIVWSKRDGEEMVPGAALPKCPFATSILARQDDTPRAGDNRMRPVLYEQPVKRGVSRTLLFCPVKTAVVGVEHNTI